jgi:hypothetical protein
MRGERPRLDEDAEEIRRGDELGWDPVDVIPVTAQRSGWAISRTPTFLAWERRVVSGRESMR